MTLSFSFLSQFDGLGWLLLMLGPLLLFQRWMHRELQLLLLRVTGHPQASLLLFSLVFLPGVFLHEASHFGMARLLGVRTGRFSLVPKPLPNGRLRLGYVETAAAGALREALIGAAPLLTGGLLIAWVGVSRLGLQIPAGSGLAEQVAALLAQVGRLPSRPDFWLWFYLLFTVSSTMFPSASDRQSWFPVLLAVGLIALLSLAAGAGPWLLAHLAPVLDHGCHAVAAVFGLSLGVHAALLVPLTGLRALADRLAGIKTG